ncbi:hypothetical protein [Agrobacterium tumefaciens]|uniref:hypothetical protein n=1 Tax=Agrobacterium tumefaciens TaxID=358 RepID=UPI0015727448|nr:hypothetical protein [Agrobacterium tumefaciens]
MPQIRGNPVGGVSQTRTFVQRSCSKSVSLSFSSPDEADKAAQAKALKLGEGSTLVTVIVDTSICAGAPLQYAGIRPALDGVPYIIDTATHRFGANGTFTTDVFSKLYDGKSSTKGDNGRAFRRPSYVRARLMA